MTGRLGAWAWIATGLAFPSAVTAYLLVRIDDTLDRLATAVASLAGQLDVVVRVISRGG